MAEKREDGKVQTEATIKIWVDGERYVRTAEGNGPVNALDTALREAISETYPHLRDIKLVNYKVRILDEWKATGAVTRVLLDASDGHDTWGAIGVHENVIEASWDALVDSLEAGMLPGREGHRRGSAERRPGADDHGRDPARPAGARRGGRARPCSRSCAPASSRSGRGSPPSRRRSPPASAPATPARSRPAPPACTSRCGRSACPTATRSSPRRSRSSRSANVIALRARAAGVRRYRPEDAQPRPTSRSCGDHRPHGRLLPVHIFGYPADIPALEATACRSSRTPARRSARCMPTASRSAAAATPRCSASTRTSS